MRILRTDRLATHPRLYNRLHAMRLVPTFSPTRPDELRCLARHARGGRTAIEIGSFMGLSTGVIASALAPGGRLYCVDPYDGAAAVLAICRRHLRRLRLSGRVVMVRRPSHDALHALPTDVDFVFVDGDHSWEGIRTDWTIVRKCLRVGGIACLHDTGLSNDRAAECPDSVRFFDEVIRRDEAFDVIEGCATLNVVRRTAG